MDRALKELAAQLITRSERIEGRTRLTPEQWHAALDLLGSLETVAKASIAQAAAAAAVPAPTAPSTAIEKLKAALAARQAASFADSARVMQPAAPERAAPQSPIPESQPATSRPEYQQALQDRRVLDALLEYHRRAAALQTEPAPRSAFAPPEIPEIQAKPKPSTRFRRNPGVSLPVLRPNGES